MKQIVLYAFTACAMLGAATIGIPAAAEAQTIIIINGNQPYYPQPSPYPYQHDVVYGYPGYYGAGYGYDGGDYGGGYGGYYGGGYYPAYGYGYRRPYWGGYGYRRAYRRW
jgi:hypothetical protein